MTEPDSRDWIKQKIAILRKKAGFSFNQDVFISILLCLISGKNKHLILIAPPDRLPIVAHMATEICRGLFGFTTANVVCQQDQTVVELVRGLFTSGNEDDERYTSHGQSPPPTTAAANEEQTGKGRHTMYSQQQQDHYHHHRKKSNTRLSSHHKDTLPDNIHAASSSSPISPVDFTIQGSKDRRHTMFPSSTANPSSRHFHHRHHHHNHHDHHHRSTNAVVNEGRKRLNSSSSFTPPLLSSMPQRLAQVLVIQQLGEANELVQAALLELIVTKEIRMANVRYNTPRPYFMTIAVLPESGSHHRISSPLLDQFFISYHCKEELFLNHQQQDQQQILSVSSASPGTTLSPPLPTFLDRQRQPLPHLQQQQVATCRRACLLRNEEIKALSEQASKVHINIDIVRYIRDIVVGIRTHPLVNGGLTARTSQDLVTVTRSLATLFRRNFLTPDLVAVAVEKVVGHRLRLDIRHHHHHRKENDDISSIQEQNVITDIVGEILRLVYAPV